VGSGAREGWRLEAARAAGAVAHGRGRPEVPAAGEGRRRGRTTEVPAASFLVVNDAGSSLYFPLPLSLLG
jgi:hypothetical protein